MSMQWFLWWIELISLKCQFEITYFKLPILNLGRFVCACVCVCAVVHCAMVRNLCYSLCGNFTMQSMHRCPKIQLSLSVRCALHNIYICLYKVALMNSHHKLCGTGLLISDFDFPINIIIRINRPVQAMIVTHSSSIIIVIGLFQSDMTNSSVSACVHLRTTNFPMNKTLNTTETNNNGHWLQWFYRLRCQELRVSLNINTMNL